MLPIAILAGGLSTRLRPITETIPKALVQVAGRPFVCRQLDYLCNQGINRVILCTGYLSEQIEAVVGNGASIGMDISYSLDGPALLGTGGAITKALPLLGEHFFVLYGDTFLPIDFRSVERAFFAMGKPALMTVFRNLNRWDKSNVLFQNGRLIEFNKHAPRPEMQHIDYGLAILSKSVFADFLHLQAFDLSEIYYMLSVADKLAGFEVMERFHEIGSPAGLRETEAYFAVRDSK